MKKICLFCGNSFTKRKNESKLDWETTHKYCSRNCANKSRRGKPNNSSTKFKKGNKPKCPFKKGMIPWNKGKSISKETREKISKALIGKPTGRTGSKCNFWKGGKTAWRDKLENSIEYKNWRREVFERDEYTCQECGDKNYKGRGETIELHPHHIKPVSEFPELACEVSNGKTLCKNCHRITESWGRPGTIN